MKVGLPVVPPFSLAHALVFVDRFPVFRNNYVVEDGALTCAAVVGGKAWPFTLREGGTRREVPADGAERELARLELEVPDKASTAVRRRLAELATHAIGATDDVRPFYAAAKDDPPMAELTRALHGLHHVRFLTLGEITVYAVMMQRAAIQRAASLDQRFRQRFGKPVKAGGRELRAMPELSELAELDAGEIADAIGHRPKAERIVDVVRGVAKLGEDFLRTAPYAEARDALLAIRGLGPFSAGAILLRGLGRMDELPWLPAFDDSGRVVYRRRVTQAEIERRYGRLIGYWSFYVMTGAPRIAELRELRA